MSSTYICAVCVTEMTITEVRLSKKMTPQTIMPCCGPLGRTIVKAECPRCFGSLHTRLRLSSGLTWKWDSSLKTIRPQSTQFHVD
ncbi:hypothetical protein TNCV_1788911 [Trichonephila clavipes]|nr:hypothetical protein TNCV_1788911 [Trichonephila clavipes]